MWVNHFGTMTQWVLDSRTALTDSVQLLNELFLVPWVSGFLIIFVDFCSDQFILMCEKIMVGRLLIQELLWTIRSDLWMNYSWFKDPVGCSFENHSEVFSLVYVRIIIGAMSQWAVDSRIAMSNSVWFVRESFLIQWVDGMLIQEPLWTIPFGLWKNHSWYNESVRFWPENWFSLVCE